MQTVEFHIKNFAALKKQDPYIDVVKYAAEGFRMRDEALAEANELIKWFILSQRHEDVK